MLIKLQVVQTFASVWALLLARGLQLEEVPRLAA